MLSSLVHLLFTYWNSFRSSDVALYLDCTDENSDPPYLKVHQVQLELAKITSVCTFNDTLLGFHCDGKRVLIHQPKYLDDQYQIQVYENNHEVYTWCNVPDVTIRPFLNNLFAYKRVIRFSMDHFETLSFLPRNTPVTPRIQLPVLQIR